ncbi:conjugal transfer protein TrbJ (plasmid) [Klebsiella sp. B345]|uniref:conjugal transfer protein TrbJ n=1 Tax=Klebsiella sp. B345 TaxID=2755398 RepID=UPI003DA96C69
MCATDRSQIAVCSQTDSIQYLTEMLNVSSSPAFIRNSRGELIHSSPFFDKIFLTNKDRQSWFSSIPMDVGLVLIKSEIISLSEGSTCLSRNVQLHNQVWTVIIECISFKGELFSKWVFIRETQSFFKPSEECIQTSRRIDRYLYCNDYKNSQTWKVFNLYAIGFTYARISDVTGLSEDQTKRMIKKFKGELLFNDRDSLILSVLNTLNYSKLALNVIDILSACC